MTSGRQRTHYELLGVTPDCTFDELRRAYRQLARERHPDVSRASEHQELGSVSTGPVGTSSGHEASMAQINEAWRVLSDTARRQVYDATVAVPASLPRTMAPFRRTGPPAPGSRRQAWAAGVQAQMARLARQAGRSATQTLLIRSPRAPRDSYEVVVEHLVSELSADVESRVRSARAAGTAPLDLGVAATLVGIRTVADGMRRAAPLGVTTESMMKAELLDRMWDVLAHELPVQLSSSLGGNPQVARALSQCQ